MTTEILSERTPSAFLDRTWVEGRLQRSGLNHSHIAQALSLTDPLWRDVLDGRRALSFHEAQKLGQLFSVTVEDISHHAHLSATPLSPAQLASDLRLVRADAHEADHRLSRLAKAALHLKTGLARLGARKP